jgi:hypothetical protein
MVTTKPPLWRDDLVQWRERPLTLGAPHENFFYPDPLGFWAEIRRWSLELFRRYQPGWGVAEALSLTALMHMGDDPGRLEGAMGTCLPCVVLFLDEPSWTRSGLEVSQVPHYISDPHRPKQVYEGFWGQRADGLVVGKAPQHPTTHRLYKAEDMTEFLRSMPAAGRTDHSH